MDRPKIRIQRRLVPIVSAYGAVFNTDQGKLVMEDLEASFGGSTYTKGDSHDTAFREGQREVLLRIKQMIALSGCEVEDDEVEQNDEILFKP